jgi:hypothetical protein
VSDDTSGTTARADLTAAVLQNAPSLSNHNDATAGATTLDLGQRGHGLNESGYGSWPYIISVDLNDDNLVEYGSDAINVVYGNTDDETSISLANRNPGDNNEIHLTITDPALNIDPTTADIWMFDLDDNDGNTTTVKFSNNATFSDGTLSSTNAAMSAAQLGDHACNDNCALSSDNETYLTTGLNTVSQVIMTETGANTGVFESFDVNGNGQFQTLGEGPSSSGSLADNKTTFSYGGNSIDMIITYSDATISFDAGGDWAPGQTATVSVNDWEANRNPTSAETLTVGDETATLPTIVMGTGGLNLSEGTNLEAGEAGNSATGTTVNVGSGSGSGGTDGDAAYSLNVFNTTDNSERLRIIHSAEEGNIAAMTSTWVNVTTGHTRAALVALPGTVVLSYDISGAADLVSSTAIAVYITDTGTNSTNEQAMSIDCNIVGNTKAGVCDLEGASGYAKLRNTSVGTSDWGTLANTPTAGTAYVTVNFKLTHAAGSDMDSDADYAIAADFCNFDQDNGSLTHNCIYRLEAVETGDNTGIFEGTVEYINLTNSTAGGTTSGEHDGNDFEVEGLLGYVKGDALSVVLMDSVSGSDSVRVVYNDTDAFQVATKIGAQLETSTHTADVSLDADSYGAGDIATITIVDADLNSDSAGRDTYQNSSTTFQVTVTQSGQDNTEQLVAATMTIIETGDNTGVFVGTFAVPDYKGSDMELTYYDAKDAGGSAVAYYDTATVVSNSGSVSFDRSVYPVPFTSTDLHTGSGGTTLQTEAGDVTAWITVSDSDETDDTLTTTAGSGAGTILIKHTNSTGSETIATAGSAGGSVDATAGTRAAELGALSEITIGSSEFEVSLTISETMSTDDGTNTIQAGDVITVEYVDTADNAGSTSTFYDSSTFDLRTGTLSVDKDVYVLGSDMVITVTDPDLNLDSGTCESYAMSLIEWDSAASSSTLLATSTADNTSTDFSSNPSALEETGCDTGVFQTVTTLPVSTVASTAIEFGEVVTLTYQDVGISGESNVEDDTLDVEASFSISNFGALVELDKALYNWTDTVYITITAPDHNNNSAAEETIGTSALPIQVTSRNGKMCTSAQGSTYAVAAETGPDTGVFEMEVALTGYSLGTANNNPQSTANTSTCSSSSSTGHDLIMAGQTDGVSVSYEYTDSVVVVASASVAFNIAEAGFDTSTASAGGSAVLSVTDADENTNSAIIDTFNVAVFSDSDNGGFTLSLAETDEDTGVFEGTVFFTADAATSGSSLRVSEGDTVTAEYSDTTLPEPYTDSDSLTVASTLTIGTAFPPLERAPAANARVVDAFGSSVAEVSVGQQVQIAADVSNGQSGDQAFAYLVQVQDGDGVTVSLAWITGSLTAGQSMSPALSWTPGTSGSYTATVFVWESVDNPTALSPTTSVDIDVV